MQDSSHEFPIETTAIENEEHDETNSFYGHAQKKENYSEIFLEDFIFIKFKKWWIFLMSFFMRKLNIFFQNFDGGGQKENPIIIKWRPQFLPTNWG